ncbi:XTP/dITP diphosphatase [Clostridium beijerinckii]|jgi:non-canonical purine NTP pyrophosphatase, rdgB/HAM1 family|uniref:dITP/XTP pyrophosphatase n=2 Tax=Clostridium beijerinckii TaxID=1520 RepID=A0AAE2V1I0_CLOBE|nr:XTP/dITP diphosphatase [Clostridium beijerinckii]ABR32544.1 non-canonical purine NTP pyrophosphatase, rdgB/HAM1 family [Clostridium beijerinckii NCIMB 8052]AIU00668.1 putative deoxyribonucleotide triphosphate pyrophosphatase [Clostridium beijerinckii ATCC 35702]MBF7807776.1 XTP/dITP diphosphatase [Clostridium beijerinckii]NOW88392.1 XTP/dITP diphosphohydrolase [Clostridium beijerinckii]NRT26225.1 XTP/dITP diphosphohydrolase [Clostridium beijerinckii]
MKKLILASNNKKKIKEMKEILKEIDIEVRSLEDERIDIDVVEDGKTFEENAKKKAKEIYEYLLERKDSNFIVLADDSGLEVNYLNGEPGIYSARYAGEHGNDSKNNEKLLNKLKGVLKSNRGAKFICQLAMFTDKGEYFKVTGEVEGYIIEELHGDGGFGYDPLFFYEPLDKTFAELTSEEKNEISHRGKALKELKKVINKLIY